MSCVLALCHSPSLSELNSLPCASAHVSVPISINIFCWALHLHVLPRLFLASSILSYPHSVLPCSSLHHLCKWAITSNNPSWVLCFSFILISRSPTYPLSPYSHLHYALNTVYRPSSPQSPFQITSSLGCSQSLQRNFFLLSLFPVTSLISC